MIYAIGDIHGQLEMLQAAHDRIARDRAANGTPDAPVVHLGDYTDRGPDSAGVVQSLIDGVADGAPWIVLKGNHDRLFTGFLRDHAWEDPHLAGRLDWFNPRLGGQETLASYGVTGAESRPRRDVHADAVAAVPEAHRAFLESRPISYVTDDLIFVHAGIRPGIPLEAQVEQDVIWIREGFLDDDTDHGHLVVHGHTVVEVPEHAGNRICLDTGAGYGKPLTAAVFEGRECWVLTDDGRVPLKP